MHVITHWLMVGNSKHYHFEEETMWTLFFLFCNWSMDEEMVKIPSWQACPLTSCPSQPWMLVLTLKSHKNPRLEEEKNRNILAHKKKIGEPKKKEKQSKNKKEWIYQFSFFSLHQDTQERERERASIHLKGLKEQGGRTRISLFRLLPKYPTVSSLRFWLMIKWAWVV